MEQQNSIPELAKPGAGLPFYETFIARHFILPRYFKKTTWDEAQSLFEREGRKCVELAESLPEDKLDQKILIKRIGGIEDSSRYWSVSMTLEHIQIVSEVMAEGIVKLSRGEKVKSSATVASVKPKGSRAGREVRDRASKATMAHPWFGELSAHQWHCLAGIHQRIHRQQIEAITRGL